MKKQTFTREEMVDFGAYLFSVMCDIPAKERVAQNKEVDAVDVDKYLDYREFLRVVVTR